MKTYTEQEARKIEAETWALTTSDGASIIRAYSKENAVAAAQARHPKMSVTADDLYSSSTIVSDCCDELVRVGSYWDPGKQEYVEEYAFKLCN